MYSQPGILFGLSRDWIKHKRMSLSGQSVRRLVRYLTGLIILVLVFLFVDPVQVWQSMKDLDGVWLSFVVLLIGLSSLIGAANLYVLLAHDHPLSFSIFLRFFWLSWGFGLVMPGQVGDIGSLTLLLRRIGMTWQNILSRAALDKILSLAITTCLAVVGLIYLGIDRVRWPIVFLAGLTVVVGAIALACMLRSKWFRVRFVGLYQNIERIWLDVKGVLAQRRGRVLMNILGTFVKFLVMTASYYAMFQAFGIVSLQFVEILMITAACSLVAYLPLSINGIGTVEVASIFLYSLIGVPEETVFGVYLLMRLTVLTVAWLPSALLLMTSEGKTGG